MRYLLNHFLGILTPCEDSVTEAWILRQVADLLAYLQPVMDDVMAAHRPASRGRVRQPQQKPDRGGLAFTIRSQETEDRVLLHLQVQRSQRLNVL